MTFATGHWPVRDLNSREAREERLLWARARRAETQYAVALRGLAKQIGLIVTGMWPEKPEGDIALALMRYAELIEPWAQATANRMLVDVSRRDQVQWNRIARTMQRSLREEILNAPTGQTLRALLDEQVTLIKSLPLDAAKRVHELALNGIENAQRPKELAEKILATGHVTASRAMLIARTETSRCAENLKRARAEFVGSTTYVWCTSGDSDVRPLHKKLDQQAFRWDSPPISGERGERSHPGCIYNCRCFSSPLIPDHL